MEAVSDKRKCPKCGKGFLEFRTPRAWWVKLTLFWLPLKRYKCGHCNKKTYVYGSAKNYNNSSDGNKLKVV